MGDGAWGVGVRGPVGLVGGRVLPGPGARAGLSLRPSPHPPGGTHLTPHASRARPAPHPPPPVQVPDRQLTLLQAGVLAAKHDWAALQHLAGRLDRKSGLTMDHFIAAARCAAMGWAVRVQWAGRQGGRQGGAACAAGGGAALPLGTRLRSSLGLDTQVARRATRGAALVC